MAEINPYQSPQFFDPDFVPQVESDGGGLWRQGNLLVMHKQAVLPDRCVKTNQPARGLRIKIEFYWHHPALYLAIPAAVGVVLLFGGDFAMCLAMAICLLIGYLILLLVVRRRAVVEVPVSSQIYLRRRMRNVAGCAVTGVAGIAMVVGIAMAAGGANVLRLGAFYSVFIVALFLCGLILSSTIPRLLSAKRITKNYIWLKGVHPDYLAELPEWPQGDAVD